MKKLKAISISNLYNKKFATMPLPEGEFFTVLGGNKQVMPKGGIWLVHGDEKQGKTTLCLSLANYLSKRNRVLYIQVEQSTNAIDIDKIFVEAMQRVGISVNNRALSFFGDINIDNIVELLKRKRSADIIFIDNITFATWINTQVVRDLSKQFSNKTFVYIAHNDRDGEPNGSTGKAVKRLANTIFSVDSLRCNIYGRGDWGGNINIDWKKGLVMYGQDE